MRLIPGIILLILLSFSCSAALAESSFISPESCLECHEDVVSLHDFGASVHGKNNCTSCHVEINDLDAHMEGEIEIVAVNCAGCHKSVAEEHSNSVHMASDIACTSCHSQIHEQQKASKDKQAIVETCQECHDMEGYAESIHAQSVAGGNKDSAACVDCHGLHNVASISDMSEHDVAMLKIEPCITCHADEELVARNDLLYNAVDTYMHDYHGKNYRLGFPEQSATCADCHGAHAVFPSDHQSSSVFGENRVETCKKCHSGASKQFAKYYVHADYHDSENYPVLYWVFVCMTGLLVGTFAVFWIHTLLWMFRGFVENREKEAALARGEAQHHIPDAHKQYVRFQKRHIWLHFTVIISFLGLSLTGLPLKFSDQAWAQTMMSFFGGVHYAGLIHRGCAVLTFYYFLMAIIMSIDFLFVRQDVKSRFLLRLFGPDSLMPNLRDIRDITGMVKWFFFKGPKPTFERWTYWEKFDFLAVFWGMFAIGGSGLLLWFPEFFGYILPGWMFNVATIIHSDEALLATGFIFTVHFFNTHGRPEKFPMDFVIFNGQMAKEEFIEERGDQWKRYEEAGMLEDFVCEKPSGVLYDFLFKGFGFLAFWTGIILAALMLYAFISH
jgi:cytochrome b subunit of formate dehydrogenase